MHPDAAIGGGIADGSGNIGAVNPIMGSCQPHPSGSIGSAGIHLLVLDGEGANGAGGGRFTD